MGSAPVQRMSLLKRRRRGSDDATTPHTQLFPTEGGIEDRIPRGEIPMECSLPVSTGDAISASREMCTESRSELAASAARRREEPAMHRGIQDPARVGSLQGTTKRVGGVDEDAFGAGRRRAFPSGYHMGCGRWLTQTEHDAMFG